MVRPSAGTAADWRRDESRSPARRLACRSLTAATVVTAIEDAEEFERFEAAIRADYQPASTIEHKLVARLASLL
jgi:hypothetical protein